MWVVCFFLVFVVLELVHWFAGLRSMKEAGGNEKSLVLQYYLLPVKYHQQEHQSVPATPLGACDGIVSCFAPT